MSADCEPTPADASATTETTAGIVSVRVSHRNAGDEDLVPRDGPQQLRRIEGDLVVDVGHQSEEAQQRRVVAGPLRRDLVLNLRGVDRHCAAASGPAAAASWVIDGSL